MFLSSSPFVCFNLTPVCLSWCAIATQNLRMSEHRECTLAQCLVLAKQKVTPIRIFLEWGLTLKCFTGRTLEGG